MKKTIIAAAVAAVVAAPAAFADVTVSGQVGYEIYDNDDSAGTQSQAMNDLVFTASEDLGNGMKASIKYHIFNDMNADATNAAATANTTVALSGDFGTIMGGRFETQNNAYFHNFADLGQSHSLNVEDANGSVSRDRGAGFEYTSPSFNGVTVVLAAQQTNADASGANSDDSGTADNDITDITVKYSNGPLTVAVGQFNYDDTAAAADVKVTNIGMKYTMGDLTVAVLNRDVENSGGNTATDNEMTTFGAQYNMGANSIAVGLVDSDDGQDGDHLITLTHNLSKSTKVYLQAKNDDSGNDTTLIGLNKKF
jgi:hypothetical protein